MFLSLLYKISAKWLVEEEYNVGRVELFFNLQLHVHSYQ